MGVEEIEKIKESAFKFKAFLEKNPNKRLIRIFTHIDTDGLTSGAIFIKMLERMKESFWITPLKQLERKKVSELIDETLKQEWKAVIFLDLGSNALDLIEKIPAFTLVIDHHQFENLPVEKTIFINPSHKEEKVDISAAGLTYLFCKYVDSRNEDLAQLAILGLIGDVIEPSSDKLCNEIIEDAKKQGMQIKKGPIIFSSMRPLHKALEFSSSVFIPGVTGNFSGVVALLREAGIEYKQGNSYKSLFDLNKDEMSRLMTAILLRRIRDGHSSDIIGNIYLIKLFGRLEDARELSAVVNACGRLNYGDIALSFLVGARKAKYISQEVYDKYKINIIRGLNYAENCEKIRGDGYIIINAKDNIKDTMIGTIISIIASSSIYPKGTILVGMAYQGEDKIKISSRVSGRDNNINLADLIKSVIKTSGGDFGGHAQAAGAVIPRDKEALFIELLERELKMTEMSIKI